MLFFLKIFFFILFHLSQHWVAVLTRFVGICVTSFFWMSSQSLIWKDPWPNAKYFFTYKSNKVNKASFDHFTALTSLLFPSYFDEIDLVKLWQMHLQVCKHCSLRPSWRRMEKKSHLKKILWRWWRHVEKRTARKDCV